MAKGYKTGGRQPGTPNKITTAVRDAILNAFQEVGGESYLTSVAKDDPRTFCTLLGKVLPTQISNEVPTKLEISWISETPPRPEKA